jgi:hypothetical protein
MRMKASSLVLAMSVMVMGCAHSTRPVLNQPSSSPATASPITNFIGAWVLNDVWRTDMGVAIKFYADGTFHYWDYSDIKSGDEPSFPITGTWRWNGTVLELTSTNRLHATRWYAYSYHGEVCLLPDYAREWQAKDGREHEDRLLFKIYDFDEKHPFAHSRKGV